MNQSNEPGIGGRAGGTEKKAGHKGKAPEGHTPEPTHVRDRIILEGAHRWIDLGPVLPKCGLEIVLVVANLVNAMERQK